MKKFIFIIPVLCTMLLFQSCAPKIVDQAYYTSVGPDLLEQYGGKDKNYIISNYPYPITDIRHLDEQYEILVFERYRNGVVGKGYAHFYMKEGKCYEVKTNEYKQAVRKVKVSYLDWLFGSY